MTAYIIRRLLIGLLIIWGVYTITFFAVDLAPGDPFTGKENAKISEADLERLRARWGYDRPVFERYLLHIRKMFWADPEVFDYEGGGVGFEVFGEGGTTHVRAQIQPPPDVIELKPTREAELDYDTKPVTIRRAEDGSYPDTPVGRGTYRLGLKKLNVLDAPTSIETLGVTLSYADGVVRAQATLEDVPDEITLAPQGETGAPVTLTRAADGSFGAVAITAGKYGLPGGKDELIVEATPLGEGGLTFDLGTSIEHNKNVVSYLAPMLWNTLKLASFALVLNFIIGISLGVFSAVRKDSFADNSIMVGAFFLYSMPGFWLAVMLQLVLAVHLGWLPQGRMAADGAGFFESLQHYIMPVFVLGVAGAAGTARYQRSAMLEVMDQDFVRTARAKGLDERTVIGKHVLRNSLLPVITLLGLSLPFLVSGAVITEAIFTWPGIGSAAIAAIKSHDVFIVTAVTLLATVMVVVGNLVADILYAVADPRVRLS